MKTILPIFLIVTFMCNPCYAYRIECERCIELVDGKNTVKVNNEKFINMEHDRTLGLTHYEELENKHLPDDFIDIWWGPKTHLRDKSIYVFLCSNCYDDKDWRD